MQQPVAHPGTAAGTRRKVVKLQEYGCSPAALRMADLIDAGFRDGISSVVVTLEFRTAFGREGRAFHSDRVSFGARFPKFTLK